MAVFAFWTGKKPQKPQMKKARRPNAPEGWQDKFIEAYRQTGNISHAARTALVDRTTVIHLRDRNKTFAARMAEAKEEALENLEYEAYRRAHDGVSKPVFYKGKPCGSVLEYSDTLLIVLLKANAPERYRENSRVEHTGSVEQITTIEVVKTQESDGSEPDRAEWEPIEI